MNPFKTLSALAMAFAMLFLPMPALGQGIPYTATHQGTTSVALDQLRDNNVAHLGTTGFAPGVASGTITFTFASDWSLSNFKIWNNINTTVGGVRDFRLDFFDRNNNQIGSFQQSILNTVLNGESFNLVQTGVRRVDMVVATSHDDMIEIREIWFEGRPSTCCPPSASFPLSKMFNSVQPNVTGNYHLNFTMDSTFDAQMAAYATLLKALDPSITSMAMAVRAYNGGTAVTAQTSGAPLQVGAVWWVPPGSTGSPWPLAAFFNSAADLPTDTWTVVEVTVWVQRARMDSVQLCETRLFSFRPQIARRARSSSSGFIDYTGRPPRTAAAPPAMPPRR